MNFTRKCCDKDHICAVDYIYKVFVPLNDLYRFIKLRHTSIKAYLKAMDDPYISMTEMVEKWFADGKLFSHCPWCGTEINYDEILKDIK